MEPNPNAKYQYGSICVSQCPSESPHMLADTHTLRVQNSLFGCHKAPVVKLLQIFTDALVLPLRHCISHLLLFFLFLNSKLFGG